MGPSRFTRISLIGLLAGVGVLALPVAALADWPQFQGDARHDGMSDGPDAPLSVAWRNDDIDLDGPGAAQGLSSPVVADAGTIVVVAPNAVLGFSAEDGTETLHADRDFGPSAQPAIADGPDGPIVVFTEGYGDNPPTGTASPSEAPDAGEDEPFDSHVEAIDLRTGRPVWDEPVQLGAVVQTPVAVGDGLAYIGDEGGTVTAVSLADGTVAWSEDLASTIAGAVTLIDDLAVVGTVGPSREPGVVVALDASSGEEVWRTGGDTIASNLVSAAVPDEGRILLLELGGGVVALEERDRGLLWRRTVITPRGAAFILDVPGVFAPVPADGRVFVVDVAGSVHAIDAETGAEVWDFALNDLTRSPLLVAGSQVLVASDSGTLAALDRRSGHLVWRSPNAGDFLRGLADAGDTIVAVAGGSDASLVAFAPDPAGPLIDEPSPTTFDLGALLAGFAVGAVGTGVAAILIARPLQRRLGPAFPAAAAAPDGDEVEA